MKNVEKVGGTGIFTRFIYKALPLAFDESLSYYECLCALLDYLEKTIVPAVNNNAEILINLENYVKELKEYVDNYFENLDVQEEINNKLDDMATSGELAEIIAEFLQLTNLFAFDTISDMASSENLTEGLICYTAGQNTYNDGKHGYYKIRELELSDIVDGFNIVAITESANLVGERLPDYYYNDLNSKINTLNNTTIPAIEDEIENLTFKKWLFIGDSYSQGYTPDGSVTGWSTLLKNKMNLTSDTCIIADHGGAGFANTTYPYSQILTDLDADEEITDILIAGGYNDTYYPEAEILTGISNCKTIIDTKFPNAKIHIGFIGGTTNQYHRHILKTIRLYQSKCLELGIDYMPNLQYILFDSRLFSSDGIHPNQNGENAITYGLYQALNGGYNYYNDIDLTVDPSSSEHFSSSSTFNLRLRQVNNTSNLSLSTTIGLNCTAFAVGNGDFIDLGSIQRYGIIGSYAYNTCYNIGNVIIHSNTTPAGYFNVPAQLFINYNGKIYIKFMRHINKDNNNYQTYGGLDNLQLDYFSVNFLTDSM